MHIKLFQTNLKFDPSLALLIIYFYVGHVTQGGEFASSLHWVDIPVLNDSQCLQQSYGGQLTFKINNMLCAGVNAGGIDR
jgi:hypothetical protein